LKSHKLEVVNQQNHACPVQPAPNALFGGGGAQIRASEVIRMILPDSTILILSQCYFKFQHFKFQ
jgi:hypothetical protein